MHKREISRSQCLKAVNKSVNGESLVAPKLTRMPAIREDSPEARGGTTIWGHRPQSPAIEGTPHPECCVLQDEPGDRMPESLLPAGLAGMASGSDLR